jgi:pyruvate dehydrogenase E1 component alpha subunit
VRLLDENGELGAGGDPPLDDSAVLCALRLMMLSRALDERAIKLNRLGRIGVYGPVRGQEASVVGACMALNPSRDWLVPAYREQPAMLRHGLPLQNLFATHMGKINAARIPEGVKILPRQQSVGAHLPHAVGIAWGLQLQEKDAVVMTYLGEGASSEGDFHEACNLAGVLAAPVVFVIQNNGWAISTPAARQTAAATLASRAQGYGFPGALVDGNDLFAVYVAAREGVDRARAGGGPTLMECRTYRMGFHNTTDDTRRYRDPAEEEVEKRRDPILRIERYLRGRGAFDESLKEDWEQAIAEEIEVAVKSAAEVASPTLDDVFDHVYEAPSRGMVVQREAMRELLGG